MAQGVFSAVRGGDFWQGAAAGFVSSLGGSAAGGLGITDFMGTVAITSAMGGLGSVIGGAKSSENILFGIVAGAMVGALNFAEEEIKETSLLDKAIVAAGFNPEDVAKWTNEEITANIAKIFPELYKAANNPTFELRDILDNNAVGTSLKTVYISNDGKYTVTSLGKILLQRGTTSSIRYMASVAGHELNHMIDYVSGTYAGWLNQYKSQITANAYSEVKAYGWERDMGSPFFIPTIYNHFNDLTK